MADSLYEKLYAIRTNFDSCRKGLPEDWQDFAAEHVRCLTSAMELMSPSSNVQGVGWQPIETAPKDGTDMLLFHRLHGVISGYFCAGETVNTPELEEYNGPMWILGDDIDRVLIEEEGDWSSHEPITHWAPNADCPIKGYDP